MRISALAAPATLALGLLLAACAARESYEAAAGRSELIGFTEREMRMCAGLPQRAWSEDGTAIWSYEHDSKSSGGLTLTSPVIYPPFGAGLSVGGNSGYCHMQVRFSTGKVVEVAFAGDADVGPARNAVCAPIVRGCLRYVRPNHPALAPAERKAEAPAAKASRTSPAAAAVEATEAPVAVRPSAGAGTPVDAKAGTRAAAQATPSPKGGETQAPPPPVITKS